MTLENLKLRAWKLGSFILLKNNKLFVKFKNRREIVASQIKASNSIQYFMFVLIYIANKTKFKRA